MTLEQVHWLSLFALLFSAGSLYISLLCKKALNSAHLQPTTIDNPPIPSHQVTDPAKGSLKALESSIASLKRNNKRLKKMNSALQSERDILKSREAAQLHYIDQLGGEMIDLEVGAS